MPSYHFALRTDVTENEDMGYISLPDDNEPFEFGRETIRLILRDHAPLNSDSAVEITENSRAVGSVSFESLSPQKKKKYGRDSFSATSALRSLQGRDDTRT